MPKLETIHTVTYTTKDIIDLIRKDLENQGTPPIDRHTFSSLEKSGFSVVVPVNDRRTFPAPICPNCKEQL